MGRAGCGERPHGYCHPRAIPAYWAGSVGIAVARQWTMRRGVAGGIRHCNEPVRCRRTSAPRARSDLSGNPGDEDDESVEGESERSKAAFGQHDQLPAPSPSSILGGVRPAPNELTSACADNPKSVKSSGTFRPRANFVARLAATAPAASNCQYSGQFQTCKALKMSARLAGFRR